MELAVTKITEPEEDDGKAAPVVHFEGKSRSMNNHWDPNVNSKITGTVRLTKEGQVRWQTISVYGGEERWQSEGIQVGGVQSQRGVLGHWFDKYIHLFYLERRFADIIPRDLDPHGPVGPTAFWKISDQMDLFEMNQNHILEDSEEDAEDDDYDDQDEEETQEESLEGDDSSISFDIQVIILERP
jgi:hypothetical protein